VGDPSGRSEERNLLTAEMVARNAAAVKAQMSKFIDFGGDNPAVLLDNNDWIGRMSFIDWLREVGKFFTVNYMVAKESVRKRMESPQGISFTEFSYMTMQAYDFLHLYDAYGCTLQCGGNDQWGNITAGVDLIRKARSGKAYGMTFPLMSAAGGEKFGKTAGNAVWLDAARTSPYQFYQYWVRTDDADVQRYLKVFTFLGLDEIAAACRQHRAAPEGRAAQKLLAAEITRIVHGPEALTRAQRASHALFGGDLTGLEVRELREIFADVPSTCLSPQRLAGGIGLADLLAETHLAKSKGEARRAITQGGVYLNNQRVADAEAAVTPADLLGQSILVLRRGKKQYHLVQVGP